MSSLLARLMQQQDLRLGVACAFPGLKDACFEEDGVRYFTVRQRKWRSPFRAADSELRKCAQFCRDFQPDVVHIHGSERFYGLLAARNLTEKPIAISLQGILGPYAEYRNFFGDLSPWQVVRSTRLAEIPMRLGLMWSYSDMRRAAKREAEIIRGAANFMGRTAWDRARVRALHPAANYFHVGETLRKDFCGPRWTLAQCSRHTIVHVNAGHSRRGTETLIRALQILSEDFPDIRLRMVGTISERSGYGRFLRRYIADHGVAGRVEMTGYLEAPQIAGELLGGHVFVIPSHIENSPNSLGEAMSVGMPCVASYVGGIPSMLQDAHSGLFFPAGDEALLAQSIRRIFEDDALASRLAEGAHDAAAKRYDADRIIHQLMEAYRSIANQDRAGIPKNPEP